MKDMVGWVLLSISLGNIQTKCIILILLLLFLCGSGDPVLLYVIPPLVIRQSSARCTATWCFLACRYYHIDVVIM